MPHEQKQPETRRCALCGRCPPLECHHVASKRQCSNLTIQVCIRCHRELSDRQYRWYPGWRTESHPIYCIVQGVCDCIAVWLERSPFADALREMCAMLAHAAVLLLTAVSPLAFIEMTWVRDTTIY